LNETPDSATLDETLRSLKTTENGLTEEEAEERQKRFGRNIIEEQRENKIVKFIKKFSSPIPWMLELTAIITFLLGKYLDTYIILFLLIFNGTVSFLQESRANDAVELLRSKIQVMTRILRDSTWLQRPASDLVPGDIVHLRMGDIVPADVKIIKGELLSDQSALTGESEPVKRGVNGVVYSGSILKKGEATCVVTSTGTNTFFGKTTELVKKARSESHVEKLILRIVRYLVVIDVVLVLAMIIYSLILKISISDLIPFSLVVLIASIPVALPATFTIATAYGAVDLSRRGALVTRLTAVEEAASVDAMCFDKTGTLTENRLSVFSPIPSGCSEDDLIRYALLSSDESSQDSIDMAIIRYAADHNIIRDGYRTVRFTPFDPSIKRTEALISHGGEELTAMKGAPQVILKICGVTGDEIMNRVSDLAKRGYRTIAVAVKDHNTFTFCGLIPLQDSPRHDSSELVAKLKSLGITTRMVTGDTEPVAREVSRMVGIGDRVCKPSDLRSGAVDIETCDVFSEVFPEDKYDIVRYLQDKGHLTGMTGDGVNDAPALKQAELGIAVSSATDVAKASASVVLTHEGIKDIVSTVEDGRKIFQRMLTYTLNKIIKTIQVAIFLILSFFIFRIFVTTPFDIILLLFANDFVTMSIATDSVRYSQKPEKWNVNSLVGSSIGLAIFIVIESFAVLIVGFHLGLNSSEIDTFIFDMLVFSGQFTVYMVRERGRFWNSRPGKWLLIASAADIFFITIISSFGILVTRIPFYDVLIVLGLTFLFMVLIDTVKNYIFRHYGI